MLRAGSERGGDERELWLGAHAALGVARFGWERTADFSGDALVRHRGRLSVAADASLYYRDALRARLAAAGVTPAGDTASDLVLAAYEAWGDDCVLHLEGDYAFALWDDARQRALLARDFSGKRPLFWAQVSGQLVVASTLEGVVSHPAVSRELDVPTIAALAATMWVETPETCYRDVRVLAGARRLSWHDGRASVHRFWDVPGVETEAPGRRDEAAERLRALLGEAASERMSGGTTAVWMSGGWDSSTVYGMGRGWLRDHGDTRALRPVSISYPVGDPGREDELIQAIADHWAAKVRWLDIGDIPMFRDPWAAAARRDDSIAHMYEHWNRALARGARDIGARVVLDGNGGDQLHQVSPTYFADLLRGGRWMQLWRDAKALGLSSRQHLMRFAVRPAVPDIAFEVIGRLRGRPVRRQLQRAVPPWFSREFVGRNRLVEREIESWPVPKSGTRSSQETRFFLTSTFFHRAFASITGIALSEGIELRSPLLDRRVVEFVAARPREDRADGPETKILLRHAARGLLPDSVLAPRKFRTGMTVGYSDRAMRSAATAAMFREAFAGSVLHELGVVDDRAMLDAYERYLRTGRTDARAAMFTTLQTELWLRARVRPGSRAGSAPARAVGAIDE
jgi:asparagine synthase (glutamine-hydrolysing)